MFKLKAGEVILSLEEIAIHAMNERGFIPEFPKEVWEELSHLKMGDDSFGSLKVRDLRSFLWVSIDNEDSRDLDQLTFAKEDKIYIAVADVDALVKKGSWIDKVANHNTTSVYTPGRVFPMLPLPLSNDLTSLNERADRSAIVVVMRIGEEGRFDLADIYPALVRNHGKLDYDRVAKYLEEEIASPEIFPFKEQLDLQDHLAQKIQSYRRSEGALEFSEIRLQPILQKGTAVQIRELRTNRAHQLIENFMIAANVGATRFLIQNHMPTIRRIVKTPKRWDRIVSLAKDLGEILPYQPDVKALRSFLLNQKKQDPDRFPDLSLAVIKLLGRGEYVLGLPGQKSLRHFDLAEIEYSHTTAPNRRFPDLVMQRLLKGCFQGNKPPYTNEELAAIASHCTAKENDAAKVERRVVKCAIAMVMKKEIGKTFKAMVTGAAEKGTWVRLFHPPIEGRLVRGFEGLDVGDYLNVKLVHVDVFNGHIDFISH